MQTKLISRILSILLAACVMLCAGSAMAQSSPDGELIDQLKKSGANLKKPYPVQFFFYVPTKQAAERIASALNPDGFEAQAEPAARGPDWVLVATKTMRLAEADFTTLRKRFNILATAEHGQYDGWAMKPAK